ncbi:hypothetical protein NUW54_g3912 [Trametes sanguinea]|uniref:Uncharacterized protein n=1 Tax=Trametes sanguinea TaxID=158606 RepID=A0ACC1Q1X4_9APHY|nr:hypothetical protein NUW54_g3912 [Trametes sanguinea]
MLTIMIPTFTFAIVATGDTCVAHMLRRILWTWMNLLQFCISNQTSSVAEDMLNKPWRPLPARRLSLRVARTIRWVLIPASLVLSSRFDGYAPPSSAALVIATLAHNELELGAHWLTRNMLNATGYAAFNLGAMSISCSDRLQGRRRRPPDWTGVPMPV